MAVAVEVAGSDRLPTRPRIGAHPATADHVGPVHFPDRGLTVRVLPQNVGMAVAVEVDVRRSGGRRRRIALAPKTLIGAAVAALLGPVRPSNSAIVARRL